MKHILAALLFFASAGFVRGAEEASTLAQLYSANDAHTAAIVANSKAIREEAFRLEAMLSAERDRADALEAQLAALQAQLAQLQQERDAALAAQGSIANATISQVQATLPQAIDAELEKLKTP